MSSDAVVFIPGIKGTKLVETNRTPFDTIWSGVQSNFETIQHLELTQGRSGVYYDERVKTIIDAGEIEQLAYAEFIDDLDTDKPVFIFNYDWRYSAEESGEQLAEFVDYLIAKSDASANTPKFKTFDFITHSLGNFVLRNYLHRKGMGKVNKIVFTVPPFKGAIDIVSTVLIGEGFFPGVKAKIRKIIRTMPGALELLPTYSEASRFSPQATHSFFNFNHWQENITTPGNPIAAKMKEVLSDAKDVVKNQLLDLSLLSAAERDRVLIIARHGYKTYQAVKVHKLGADGTKNFVDLEKACRTKHGDARVPHASSCVYHDSIKTLMLTFSRWNKDYSHGFVLKDERLQKIVNRFLFGDGPFTYSIPGQSVRLVTGLNKVPGSDTDLSCWEAQF